MKVRNHDGYTRQRHSIRRVHRPEAQLAFGSKMDARDRLWSFSRAFWGCTLAWSVERSNIERMFTTWTAFVTENLQETGTNQSGSKIENTSFLTE